MHAKIKVRLPSTASAFGNSSGTHAVIVSLNCASAIPTHSFEGQDFYPEAVWFLFLILLLLLFLFSSLFAILGLKEAATIRFALLLHLRGNIGLPPLSSCSKGLA
jgi:phosphatidylserine synthase